MDQLVVATGQAGHALLIDCRDLTTESLPVPVGSVVVVLDTSTRRGLIDSSYNDRRASCEAAAGRLGLRSLRELERHDLERRSAELPEAERGLVRHVVSENARTLAGAAALRKGDAAAFGRLMVRSHQSLRDDFGVSSDALDTMVLAACAQPGCFGARMTGAGFAGCAVALVEETAMARFSEAVQESFRRHTGLPAAIHACRPKQGVSVQVLG
jgi:galactokinase